MLLAFLGLANNLHAFNITNTNKSEKKKKKKIMAYFEQQNKIKGYLDQIN